MIYIKEMINCNYILYMNLLKIKLCVKVIYIFNRNKINEINIISNIIQKQLIKKTLLLKSQLYEWLIIIYIVEKLTK